MEFAISLGVVSVAGLVFLFAVERFHIWEKRPKHPESDPHAEPRFDHTTEVWLGSPVVAARTKYSLAFITSFAVAFALIPGERTQSKGILNVPVYKARGGDTLFVDGNRDGYGVVFYHAKHADSLNPPVPCASCHHMNVPQDKESGCWECHRSMYTQTDVFDHDWHTAASGGNIACNQCHDPEVEREDSTAKKCEHCHIDLVPSEATIIVDNYMAGSYTDVMHEKCIGCHKKRAAEIADKPDLALCPTCHQSSPAPYLRPDIMMELAGQHFNRVTIPADSSETGEIESETDGQEDSDSR
jgi:hypothetical protein